MAGYQRGVIPSEVPTSLLVVQPADAAIIAVVGAAPIHSVPGYAWSASGYASAINVAVLCEVPSDFTTELGVSTMYGPGVSPAYGCSELYDYAFTYNNAGPFVAVNVWNPFTMSTPVTMNGLTIDSNDEITINDEVILASLVVAGGGGTTYVAGTDYEFQYNDNSLQSGVIVVFANSALINETTVNVSFYTPNLTQVTADDIIGGVDVNGNVSGLEVLDTVYDKFNVTIAHVITPGFSQNDQVAAAANARVQSLSNGRFKAGFIADADWTAVTHYSQLSGWKSSHNYESMYENLVWPNVSLGTQSFHGSTVLAVLKNTTTKSYGNLPYASPSNKEIVGDGTILSAGVPISVGLTQADYIEELGIVTFVNSQGWKSLGDYTCSFDSGTIQASDPVDFWINERDYFTWLENTFSIFLAGAIDLPGNTRSLSQIENSMQQFLNTQVAAGASWTGTARFNPDENPAYNILAGIYTFHILVSPVTPIRTLDLKFEYDVAGLSASIQSLQLTSS